MRINGCGMSAQHALVLVCTGFCNANDIRRVEKTVKEIVLMSIRLILKPSHFIYEFSFFSTLPLHI